MHQLRSMLILKQHSYLLGTGGDGELGLDLESMVGSLTRDGCGAGHVLVTRVGARSDERDLEFRGPLVLLDRRSEFGDGGSEIGCERSVDMGFQFREVLSPSKTRQ